MSASLAFLLVAVCAVAAAEVFPGADAKWRRYESPHFELISRQGDESSRRLLHDLELLRACFLEANGLVVRQPVPVTIYAFGQKRDFAAYLTDSIRGTNPIGVYLHRPDRAVIYVAPDDDIFQSRRLIFHEYIHHLVRATGMNPPTWLNEGLAELFSTIEVRESSLVFGKPASGHVALLQRSDMIPLERLLVVNQAQAYGGGAEHVGVFYAQSWALLHYWYFSEAKLPRERIDRMIRMLLSGRPLSAEQMRRLFEEATGTDYTTMEKQLAAYVRGGRYGWQGRELPKVPPRESYAVKPLSVDEARLYLAELRLRTRRDPHAKFALLDAAGKGYARAWEVLGTDALADQHPDVAHDRWGRAIEAGTQNPAIYHEVGLEQGRRWLDRFDVFYRLPPERAEELRSLLLRSIEFAPQQSEAYEMLAWVEAYAPEPAIANVNRVQAKFATLNDKARTLLALAMVRYRKGDSATAAEYLAELEKAQPDILLRRGIEAIRARIERRPERHIDAFEGTPASKTMRAPVSPEGN